MDKDAWIKRFVEELRGLRPHLTERYLAAVAGACYTPGKEPDALARAYHARQIDQQPGRLIKTA